MRARGAPDLWRLLCGWRQYGGFDDSGEVADARTQGLEVVVRGCGPLMAQQELNVHDADLAAVRPAYLVHVNDEFIRTPAGHFSLDTVFQGFNLRSHFCVQIQNMIE